MTGPFDGRDLVTADPTDHSLPPDVLAALTGIGGSLVAKGELVVSAVDHGVIGNGTADDTTALLAAAAAALATKRTLWVPPGLVGVKITATCDLRYIDVNLESPIVVAFTTAPGLLLGDTSVQANRRILSFVKVTNSTTATFPSIRVSGLKQAIGSWGTCDYLQLFADAAVAVSTSIAYCNFDLSGGAIALLEFFGQGGVGWINSNRFIAGRLVNVRFTGTYPHNGNIFVGPTVESGFLDFQVGSDNRIQDARGEGSPTVSFGATTWGNIVEDLYQSTPGTIGHNFDVIADLGVANVVTGIGQIHQRPVELFTLDRTRLTFDTAADYPHPTTPVPGLQYLTVRTANADIYDSGKLPVERIAATSGGVIAESMRRLRRFQVDSSHKIWRPRVYCYDAAGVQMDTAAAQLIAAIGGWTSNGAGAYYSFGTTVAFARIVVLDPAVKFLRIAISSSSAAGTVFEWLTVTGFVSTPDVASMPALWRRASTIPLTQNAVPTQGVAGVGAFIGSATGGFVCNGRADTTLAAGAAAAATSLTVASITGMAAGDLIGILLTDGTTHWTTVSGTPTGVTVVITTGLASAATSGDAVVTNRWITLAAAATSYVRKSADTTKNNTVTLTADTHLTLPVVSGGVYEVQAFLNYSATTVADILVGWTAPAGSVFDWTTDSLSVGTTGTTGQMLRARAALAGTSTLGGAAAAAKVIARPIGLLVAGADGNLAMTWAQATAEVSDSIIYAGSFLKLTRIA